MTWILLGGLITLVVVLTLAVGLEVKLDNASAKAATVAAVFLSFSLVFSGISGSFDPAVTTHGQFERPDLEVVRVFSVLTALTAGLAWLFILIGLVRFAKAQDQK
jgi:hypothetical protein